MGCVRYRERVNNTKKGKVLTLTGPSGKLAEAMGLLERLGADTELLNQTENFKKLSEAPKEEDTKHG